MNTRISLSFLFALLTLAPAGGAFAQYAGNALYLDSADSYATAGDPSAFNLSEGTPFTIEAWVYVNSSNIIIASGYDGSSTRWTLRVGTYDGENYRLILDDNDGFSSKSPGSIGAGRSFSVGEWNHAAVRSDGSTIQFFVNGYGAGTFTDDRSIWGLGSSATIYLGTEQVASSSGLLGQSGRHGVLDNMRFWNVERSEEEIRQAMSAIPLSTTGLTAEYTFDGSTGYSLFNGAYTDASLVPSLTLAADYQEYSVTAWNGSSSAESWALTVSADDFSGDNSNGEYLVLGDNHNGFGTTMDVPLPDLQSVLTRVWSVSPIGVTWSRLTFDMTLASDIDLKRAVAVVSTDSTFQSDFELVFATVDDADSTITFNYDFSAADQIFVTLGELDADVPELTASLGFGPFLQGYDNLDTFSVSNLPSETEKVEFVLYDQNGDSAIDSYSVTGSDLASAEYGYQMGGLPMGTLLEVTISAASLDADLTLVEPLSITETTPYITATNNFDVYVLGTERTVTYTVDSLPDQTTGITFRMVDIDGLIIGFFDTAEQVIYDSLRIEGTDLTTGSWTLRLDTLDLPLSTQLSVTIEHENGIPGGTEYLTSLQVLASPITIFSTEGWGPFTSKDYDLVANPLTPWTAVTEEEYNEFTLSPLPPRTVKAIYQVLDGNDSVLAADTVSSNGVEFLTSANSSSISMTDLPPGAVKVVGTVFAKGGPNAGLSATHVLSIVPQSPRVWLEPSDYRNAIRNTANPDDTTTTPVTINIEPSTAETDSVVIRFIDVTGAIIDEMSAVPTVLSDGVTVVQFEYDFASLPYTADSIQIHTYSPIMDSVLESGQDIALVPGYPKLTTLFPLDDYQEGIGGYEQITLSDFPNDVESVILDFAGTVDTFGVNTTPWRYYLDFAGDSTWGTMEVPQLTLTFNISTWIRTDDSTAAPIVGTVSLLGATDSTHTYYPVLYLDDDGRLVFAMPINPDQTVRTPFAINDGDWHNVTVIVNDLNVSSNPVYNVYLYVDGGLVTWKRLDFHTFYTHLPRYIIGRGAATPTEFSDLDSPPEDYFNGQMGSFFFWTDEILTGDEVQRSLFYGGTPEEIRSSGLYNYLYAYFDYENGSGRLIYNKDNWTDTLFESANWSGYSSLTNVGRTVDITGLEAGTQKLNVTMLYPDGDPAGVTYTWDVDVAPTSYGIGLKPDYGFGPFQQGESADVSYTLSFTETDSPLIDIKLVDSTGATIAEIKDTTTSTISSRGFSFDMGEAEPGSQIEARVYASDMQTPLSDWVSFPVNVDQIVPPTIQGNTGPFKQAIAEGVMQQLNTFKITSFDDDVRFVGTFYNSVWDSLGTVDAVQRNDTTWSLTYDMGSLSPPLTRLVVDTYVGTSTVPAASDTLRLTIIRTRPDWFNDNVTFSNVRDNGEGNYSFSVEASFDGESTTSLILSQVDESFDNLKDDFLFSFAVPDFIPIIGGEGIDGAHPTIKANLTYNEETEELGLSGASFKSGTSFFGADISSEWEAVGAYLDSENNLIANVETKASESIPSSLIGGKGLAGKEFNIFKWARGEDKLEDVSVIAPYIAIKPNLSYGSATRLNMGVNDDRWGAVGSLDLDGDTDDGAASYQVTQFNAGVTLALGVQALWGVAALQLDLKLRGVLGAGAAYRTVPETANQALWGVGVQLYGELEAEFLWGFVPVSIYGPKMFYHTSWGDDIPLGWPEAEGWPWSGTEKDVKGEDENAVAGLPAPSEGTNFLTGPLVSPQPAASVRNGGLAAVWMEQDPATKRGTLMLGTVGEGNFPNTMTVVSNRSAVSNPQITNLTDSTHIVTWSQSRYTPETAPEDASIVELATSLDVWYAVVNSASRVVEQTGILQDDFSSETSGRLEGNGGVTPLSPSSALITWIVADPDEKSSEIYYSLLKEENGIWSGTEPAVAAGLSGIEHSLRVVETDGGGASAVWINRTSETSDDPRVMTMEWDGTGWSEPEVLLGTGDGLYYNDLHGVTNGERGLLAVVGTAVGDGTGDSPRSVVITVPWLEGKWDTFQAFVHEDTLGNLQRPRAALNADGKGVVVFHRNQVSTDGESIFSMVDILVNDQLESGNWEHIAASPFVGDSSAFVRDIEAVLLNDLLLVFAHELKTPYSSHQPVLAKRIGLQNMNLVLRGVKLDGGDDLVDIDEEDLSDYISAVPTPERPAPGFSLESVAPSPFAHTTSIAYRLAEPGRVRLEVIDSRGETLMTLVDALQNAGTHRSELQGAGLPNGAYFIRLTVDGLSVVRTVLKVE